MNERVARRGDVFMVYRSAAPKSNDVKLCRPKLCVAELRLDPDVWKAMSRLTSGQTNDDLPSAPNVELSLDKSGWWSRRFVHPVLKSKLDTPACEYRGELPEPEKSQALAHYNSRPRTSKKSGK